MAKLLLRVSDDSNRVRCKFCSASKLPSIAQEQKPSAVTAKSRQESGVDKPLCRNRISKPIRKGFTVKFKSPLPAFALAILAFSLWLSASVAVSAQDAPKAADAKPNPLALTEAERKAFEPLQQAILETNQELAVAADALDAAKAADVLAAAWRWKAALTAFKSALRERGNWIATTAKAHGCEGCELNLQTMELQKAKQQ